MIECNVIISAVEARGIKRCCNWQLARCIYPPRRNAADAEEAAG